MHFTVWGFFPEYPNIFCRHCYIWNLFMLQTWATKCNLLSKQLMKGSTGISVYKLLFAKYVQRYVTVTGIQKRSAKNNWTWQAQGNKYVILTIQLIEKSIEQCFSVAANFVHSLIEPNPQSYTVEAFTVYSCSCHLDFKMIDQGSH